MTPKGRIPGGNWPDNSKKFDRDLNASRVDFNTSRQDHNKQVPKPPVNKAITSRPQQNSYPARDRESKDLNASRVHFNVGTPKRTGSRKIEDRSINNASVEPQSYSAQLLNQAVKGEYRYGMLGLILGLASIVGGIILGLHGVAGHTSWTAKLLGFESSINDAAPGVVLFIVGMFLVYITKPRVKFHDLKG